MLRTNISTVFAVLALSIGTANAQDEASQIGSRPLDPGQHAVAAGSGFPSVIGLQHTAGVAHGLDVGVRADVYAASPLAPMDVGAAAGVAVPLRFSLGSRAPWSFALRLSPDVAYGHMVEESCHRTGQEGFHCHEGTGVAIGMDVAFLAGVATTGPHLVTGIGFPTHVAKVQGQAGMDVVLPATILGGLEVPLGSGMNAFALLQPGVALYSTSEGTRTDGFFRFSLGIESAL